MSHAAQRITATQVYSQVEIEAWWRDWCAYLESHLTMLDARLAGDRAVFERDDATEQQRTLAQQRLQAIAATRRSVFDRVRESLRQAEQIRQETAGRALAPLDPDAVERALLTRLLAEARGASDGPEAGQGWVPLDADESTWMRVDVAALRDLPSDAAYQVGTTRGEHRRALLLLAGASLLAVALLGLWALWPRTKSVAPSIALPRTVNAQPIEGWIVDTLVVTDTEGIAQTLPISMTTAPSWPARADDAPPLAFVAIAPTLPLQLCLPMPLLDAATTLALQSEAETPSRIYALLPDTASGTYAQLRVTACDSMENHHSRIGQLRDVLGPPVVAIGTPVAIDRASTLTVMSIAIVGNGQDPSLPAGQARIEVHVAAPQRDWPADRPALLLTSGQTLLPSAIQPTATGVVLSYLVAEPTAPLDVVWELAPAGRQRLRWRATLPPPLPHLAALRQSLVISGVELRPGVDTVTIQFQATNTSTAPFLLAHDDVQLVQGMQTVQLPDDSAFQTPLAPGETRSVALAIPQSALRNPATLTVGGVRFALNPEGGDAIPHETVPIRVGIPIDYRLSQEGVHSMANPFEQIATTITAWLQALMIPGAIIGILFCILSFVIGPLFPNLSASSKGHIQLALLGIAFSGFVPTIVTTLAGAGG